MLVTDKFNVETQSGIVSRVAECQTGRRHIEDASVDCFIERKSMPALLVENGDTYQTPLPAKYANDIAVQWEMADARLINKKLQIALKPVSHDASLDAELKTRTVDPLLVERGDAWHTAPVRKHVDEVSLGQAIKTTNHVDGEAHTMIVPDKFNVETQAGIVNRTSACQTGKPRVENAALDFVIESKPLMPLLVEAGDTWHTPAPHKLFEDISVGHAVSYAMDGAVDSQIVSKTINPAQAEGNDTWSVAVRKPINDVSVQWESAAAPLINKKLQIALRQPTHDATMDSQIHLKTVNPVILDGGDTWYTAPPKKFVDDVSLGQVIKTTQHLDGSANTMIVTDKYNVETQAGIVNRTAICQTEKVVVEDANVDCFVERKTVVPLLVEGNDTWHTVAPKNPVSDTAVQWTYTAPPLINKKIQITLKTPTQDITMDSQIHSKSVVPVLVEGHDTWEASKPKRLFDDISLGQTISHATETSVQCYMKPEIHEADLSSLVVAKTVNPVLVDGSDAWKVESPRKPYSDTAVQWEMTPVPLINKKLQITLKPPTLDATVDTKLQAKTINPVLVEGGDTWKSPPLAKPLDETTLAHTISNVAEVTVQFQPAPLVNKKLQSSLRKAVLDAAVDSQVELKRVIPALVEGGDTWETKPLQKPFDDVSLAYVSHAADTSVQCEIVPTTLINKKLQISLKPPTMDADLDALRKEKVVSPVLVEGGDSWHTVPLSKPVDEISVATERPAQDATLDTYIQDRTVIPALVESGDSWRSALPKNPTDETTMAHIVSHAVDISVQCQPAPLVNKKLQSSIRKTVLDAAVDSQVELRKVIPAFIEKGDCWQSETPKKQFDETSVQHIVSNVADINLAHAPPEVHETSLDWEVKEVPLINKKLQICLKPTTLEGNVDSQIHVRSVIPALAEGGDSWQAPPPTRQVSDEQVQYAVEAPKSLDESMQAVVKPEVVDGSVDSTMEQRVRSPLLVTGGDTWRTDIPRAPSEEANVVHTLSTEDVSIRYIAAVEPVGETSIHQFVSQVNLLQSAVDHSVAYQGDGQEYRPGVSTTRLELTKTAPTIVSTPICENYSSYTRGISHAKLPSGENMVDESVYYITEGEVKQVDSHLHQAISTSSQISVDNTISYALVKTDTSNKKMQVNLVTSTDGGLAPLSRSDRECQVKPHYIGKKMQCSPICDEHGVQAHLLPENWDQDVNVEKYLAILRSNRKDSGMQTGTGQTSEMFETGTDAMFTKYTTRVLQAQPSLPVPTLNVSSAYTYQSPPDVIVPLESQRPLQSLPVPRSISTDTQDAACDARESRLTKSPYMMTHIQVDVPTDVASTQATQGYGGSRPSQEGGDTQPTRRHVRIQKGSCWLHGRLRDSDTQTDSDVFGPRSLRSSIRSNNGRTGMTSPYQLRGDVISWGVQCAPMMLTGVTQTEEMDTSQVPTGAKAPAKGVQIQTKTDDGDDEYVIHQTVTTIAKRGTRSTHSHPHIVTSSLPGELDVGGEPRQSGSSRVIRYEGEETGREVRAQSEDSQLSQTRAFGRTSDCAEDSEIFVNAEECFRNLLHLWGPSYMMSRLSRRVTAVDRDVSDPRSGPRSSRLIGAKTQFYSTGSLYSPGDDVISGMHTSGTQTQEVERIQLRPPHKHKRIQRGQSYISGSPTNVSRKSSLAGSQLGMTTTTTFTETIREEAVYHGSGDEELYVCPKCGTCAREKAQTLPITQLKSTPIQTKLEESNIEKAGLPIFLSEEEVSRIDPDHIFVEDKELSVVTWCPAGASSTDEVYIDSPGKLHQLKVANVTVPGTNETISAAEAFYRGILRVVYWDYSKVGPRQSAEREKRASIPIVDAVLSKAVKLITHDNNRKARSRSSRGVSTLDARVVWTTPNTQRTRYLVHSIQPDAETSVEGSATSYNISSAIQAGYVDTSSGQLFIPSDTRSDKSDSASSSKLSDRKSIGVKEAIKRGIVSVELIESDTPFRSDPYTTGGTAGYQFTSPQSPDDDVDV